MHRMLSRSRSRHIDVQGTMPQMGKETSAITAAESLQKGPKVAPSGVPEEMLT